MRGRGSDIGGAIRSCRYAGIDLLSIRGPADVVKARLVLLHGYGGTAIQCLDQLPLRGLLQLGYMIVIPHGFMNATLVGGRAWFTLTGDPERQRVGALHAAARVVAALSEHALAEGRLPTFVAGFSQGGAVALAIGLEWPNEVTQIITLAASLRPVASRATDNNTPAVRTFVLMAAEYDAFAPPLTIEGCHQNIKKAGHVALLVRLPGGAHAVSGTAWRCLRRALRAATTSMECRQ